MLDLKKCKVRWGRENYVPKKVYDFETKPQKGTPEEIASTYGEGASVYSMTGLSAESTTIDNVGSAPEVVGTVFGLAAGQLSAPIQTRSGVVVVLVNNITTAAEVADYSAYKDQLSSNRNGRTSYNLSESIKKAAKIKDERHLFY